MKDFNWRRLAWVLITLGSAFMIWLGLVMGAVAPGWEGFGWVVSVPMWATLLRASIETLEYMAWERLTRKNVGHLLHGVMAAIQEQNRAERYQIYGDDDGARLMREISEALTGDKVH